MKHAKERVVLTFSHFITETGKQISTYHQDSAVNTTLRVSFCFSFKVLNESEKNLVVQTQLAT